MLSRGRGEEIKKRILHSILHSTLFASFQVVRNHRIHKFVNWTDHRHCFLLSLHEVSSYCFHHQIDYYYRSCRIFPIDETIIFTPFGLCSALGSSNLCFAIYSIMFWGHSFYCFFLAFCFCYRLVAQKSLQIWGAHFSLYIIIYDIPSTQWLMTCILVVMLPSTIIYVVEASNKEGSLIHSLGVLLAKWIERTWHPARVDHQSWSCYRRHAFRLVFSNSEWFRNFPHSKIRFSGKPGFHFLFEIVLCIYRFVAFDSIFEPRVFAGLVWITAPFGPCYVIILCVGYRLIKILSNESTHMSARRRRAHKEIVKVNW